MKTAIVYDPDCPKLRPDAYSQCYRDMFLALIEKFQPEHITRSQKVEADVVIYYDIHSSHHIEIETDCELIYEYFNDPWQTTLKGTYTDGTPVHKLNAKDRTQRALKRGVKYIICPYTNLYYRYIYPHAGDMELVWFPIAPDTSRFRGETPLVERKPEVLLNGHVWKGQTGFRPYEFRRWAYNQDCVTTVPHSIADKNTPNGLAYPKFLSEYAGALALTDMLICPKYSEIPMSGCVCFAQYQYDYEQMGFKDMESCVYVTKANFNSRINDFKNDAPAYQSIADAGRKIMENYTADKFAEYIYSHASRKH